MALDFTCLHTLHPNFMASISSTLGGLFVLTFSSIPSKPRTLGSASMTKRPPGADRITGSFIALVKNSSATFISLKLFFFCKMALASLSKSGAIIMSVNISAITLANASSKGRLQTITPPKGACLSVSKAFSHASLNPSPSSAQPTPHGFVCFKIATVGLKNSETN